MAVTTNCKQFFFFLLKSTVLQHLQQKYKSPKIKHLFSFPNIKRSTKKKPVQLCTESKTIHKNGMFNVKNQLNKPNLLHTKTKKPKTLHDKKAKGQTVH